MKEVNVSVLYYKLGEVEQRNVMRILTGKVYLYDIGVTHMEVANFTDEVDENAVFWLTPTKKYLDKLFQLFNSDKNPILADEDKMREIKANKSHTSMSIGDVVVLQDKTFQEYWRLDINGWQLFTRNRIDFW